jgi:hypothetical protein
MGSGLASYRSRPGMTAETPQTRTTFFQTGSASISAAAAA